MIVLRHESAERSTTAEGIADHVLVYADPDDLRATLARLLIAITRDTLPGPL